MKKIFLTGAISVLMLTACDKNNSVAEKSLEQQKVEFQQRQLEIEKQKLAIEKERMAYETQKKADSIANVEKSKTANQRNTNTVVRETVYRDRPVYVNSGNSNSGSSNSGTTQTTQKKGMSKAAKGAIIGTVGGAAAGAIISKKNPAAGAVIGGAVDKVGKPSFEALKKEKERRRNTNGNNSMVSGPYVQGPPSGSGKPQTC